MKRLISVLATALFAMSLFAMAPATAMGERDATEGKGTVLVAGASGKTGRYVMAQLQAQGYTARGMTRNVERAKENVPGDYEWVQGDAKDPATVTAAMEGVDYVISTIGAGPPDANGPNAPEFVDYGGVRNLVDAAVAADVKHFALMSSQGATADDPENPLNKMFNNVLVWKLKGEDHLRASGLGYTIVRASVLEGTKNEPGTVGLLFDQGDDTTGVIHRADCATVMIAALTDPDANRKTLELFNDEDAPADNWRDGGFAALVADE